jgi:hypothetical protein
MLDGQTADDFGVSARDVEDDKDGATARLATALEESVNEFVESQSSGFALGLAQSFLSAVDWAEIAEHFIDDLDEAGR